MVERFVNITDIDRNCFEIKPPRWVLGFCSVVLSTIYIGLIFAPFDNDELKWLIIVILTLVLISVFKGFAKGDYLLTLIANQFGLYFYTGESGEFYYVPWIYVGVIEKTIYPINSRGLRLEIDCSYIEVDMDKLENVVKEGDRCFIQTIPQLLNRDNVIRELEFFRGFRVKAWVSTSKRK